MIKNILYLFRETKTKLGKMVLGEFFHGLLLAMPTGILLMIIWELFKENPNKTFIWQQVAVMAVLLVFQLFYARKVVLHTNNTLYKMTCALRIRLGNHLQKLSLGYYKKRDPGDLASVVLQDVSNVEMLLGHTIQDIFGAIFGTFFLSLFLFILDWKLALVMLIALPIGYLFVLLAAKMARSFSQSHIASRNETGSRFIEYINGIRHLKAFNLTGPRFATLQKAFAKLRRDSIRVEAVPGPFVMLSFIVFELFFLMMVYFGIHRLVGETLSIPAFVAFLVVGYRLYEPLKLLMVDYAMLRYMNVSLQRIIELMHASLQDEGKQLEPKHYEIAFDHVTFSYLDRKVLKDVSFQLPAHKMTALVGASGSGKTTIANLIARFWDVQQGTVAIGGVNVQDMAPEKVYALISQVFQDVYLFDDTIYNNILIGNMEATSEQVYEVAQKAQVLEFIDQLPNGLQTRVGEGGSHLSGGQKQRISIARAMLKDAPIILLDEATAALDPENEIYIQQAIQSLVKDKTVVVIAHKLQTIMQADHILVLDEGRIAENGNHEQLLKLGKRYASFWKKQQTTKGWRRIA